MSHRRFSPTQTGHRLRVWVPLAVCALLAGCGAWRNTEPRADDVRHLASRLLPADALLLGERHDAPEHQLLQRLMVQTLAARGQLAAVALEMAEQGAHTIGLPANASEETVRATLKWHDAAWPWSQYGPVVMAAVRAGVPVRGANPPREVLRAARHDQSLDPLLDAAALARQQAQIRDGHCGQLPESQILPMTRMQIARDRAMAQTITQLLNDFRRPGQAVLLIAGGWHVRRGLGVPVHVPPDVRVKVLLALSADAAPATRNAPAEAGPPQEGLAADDVSWWTPAVPEHDPCGPLRRSPPARTD